VVRGGVCDRFRADVELDHLLRHRHCDGVVRQVDDTGDTAPDEHGAEDDVGLLFRVAEVRQVVDGIEAGVAHPDIRVLAVLGAVLHAALAAGVWGPAPQPGRFACKPHDCDGITRAIDHIHYGGAARTVRSTRPSNASTDATPGA
jgi:hypothetical protein